MPDNKDTNAEGPVPIFVSFIYDFVPDGLGGDAGGRPGTLGGTIGEQAPKFRVLTYQYTEPAEIKAPNIANT